MNHKCKRTEEEGISIEKEGTDWWYDYSGDDYCHVFTIKYCPFCGEKLE